MRLPPRRAALAFIFVTVMLDMLALGIVIPVLPPLIRDMLGGDTARAAETFGLFGTAWALMQFIFSPLLGAISDRVGRRPVVLLSNFGLGLDYIVMAIAPNLGWLLVGRVVSGITAASISTSFAYIADVTPPDRRAAAFGTVGAAFGLGFVLGPAVGGLLGEHAARLPFWAAAAMSLANAAYGLFVLPESLPRERRAALALSRANPFGSLLLLGRSRRLVGLAVGQFLSQLAHVALPSTFVLYASYRFGWSEGTVGLALAAVGICSMVVQGGLVGAIVGRLGERAAMAGGLALGMAGFAVFGVAPSGVIFVLGIPLMSLWGLANPATQALMSRIVAPSEQGRLQGANSSVQGLAGLVGPSIFTLAFARGIAAGPGAGLPGAAFLLASFMLLGAALASFAATRPSAAIV
jgi:DHA1 family tetracycline resistance protein-like MFS transporter